MHAVLAWASIVREPREVKHLSSAWKTNQLRLRKEIPLVVASERGEI